MESFPITELAVAGAEGMVAQSESRICELGESVFTAWADFSYETARERSIVASSEHILHIGRKNELSADGP